VLNYSNAYALGTGNVTFTGAGTLQAGVSGTLANLGANSSVTGTFDTQTNAVALSGGLTGAGNITQVGSGTLTISGSSNDTGDFSINGGVVALAGAYALPTATGTITFGGGTLQFNALDTADYSSRIANSGSAISIDTNGQNVTFNSALAASNTGGLTKLGAGQLTLNGAQNFRGPTTVNSGTLQTVNGASLGGNVGNYPLTVNSGGALDLAGQTIYIGALSGNGTIVDSSSAATLSVYRSTTTGLTSTFAGTITGALTGNSSIALQVRYGTLTLPGVDQFGEMDIGEGGTGSVIITGSVNAGGVVAVGKFGGAAGGYLTINGGYFAEAGTAPVWAGSDGPGYITLNSGTFGISSATSLIGASIATGTSVFNLNGGLLLTDNIYDSQGNVNSVFVFNFNGGTLRVNGNDYTNNLLFANFDGGYQETTITAGSGTNGAVIDTNGFSSLIVRPIGNAPGQAGTLTKLGAGTLTLGNANGYTGATTISSGTLAIDYSQIANDQNSTPDNLLYSGTTVNIAGGAALEIKGRPNGATESSAWKTSGTGINNQGELLQTSAGSTTAGLAVGESVSGPDIPAGSFITEIYNANTFAINNQATIASSTATMTFTGTTFNPVNQSVASINLTSGTGIVDVEANGGSGMTLTVTNSVTGPGALQLNSTTGGLLAISGSSSYSGGTIITGGTLQTGNAYALGTGNLAVNAGTLDLYGNSITVGALSGSSGGLITTSSNVSVTLTTAGASNSTYGGKIQDGSGQTSLTQAGSATLTLSGSSSYSGATNVNSGTLIVSGSLSGTGSASVASGGTLEVDGLLNHSATTTLNGGTLQGAGSVGAIIDSGSSTVAPGLTAANSQTATGTLTANGNVTLSGSTNFNIRLGFTSGTTGDQLAVNSGNVSLNDANLNLTLGSAMNNPALINTFYAIIVGGAGSTGSGSDVFGSYNGTAIVDNTFITSGGWQFNILYAENATGTGGGNDVVLELTAIPEPGTWATMLSGFGMLLVVQRLRRKGRHSF